jgi:hypothetical protein
MILNNKKAVTFNLKVTAFYKSFLYKNKQKKEPYQQGSLISQ